MLIVLDNAGSAEQVRPLLPGSGGCFVVITSRDRLGGLVVTDGARSLPLDVLTETEALDLLRRSLGAPVVDAQAPAAARLTRICGCLPLALRIAAAHLTGSPRPSIQEYLRELAAAGPVEALSIAEDPDVAVRATFDTSYARLSPAQQRVFRMLSLAPGTDISVAAVAVLTGIAEATARRLLDQLTAVHLVTHPTLGRYRLHDLLREYAEQRTQTEDSPTDRTTAVERLLNWYLHRARAANQLLYSWILRLDIPPVPSSLPPVEFDDPDTAVQWLGAERANLLTVVHHTAQHGPPRMACMMLDTMRGYLWSSRQVVDWWEAVQAANTIAEQDGDPRLRAAMLISLGAVHTCLQQPQAAIEACTRAKQQAADAGWLAGEAMAANNLASIHDDIGQVDLALHQNLQALGLYVQAQFALGVFMAKSNRVFLLHLAGRLREAEDLLKHLIEEQPSMAPRTLEIHLWHYMGVVSSDLGHLAAARAHLTRALALTSQANRLSEALVRRDLAVLEFEIGQLRWARMLAHEALQLARDVGERRVESRMLNLLGSISCAEAEPQRALDLHAQALRLARTTHDRYEADASLGLAQAYSAIGDHSAAVAAATDAIRLAQDAGLRLVHDRALTALARITLRAGDPERAAQYADEALTRHRQTGHRLGEARALAVLEELADHRGDSTSAEEHAIQAKQICVECGADPETVQGPVG
ncbi:MAG TPA: tetratricopeptide repeat protein [Rugosimonospora sp.]|nr:tetratricopeptide repeat protein [Rugosimonospora sp.]